MKLLSNLLVLALHAAIAFSVTVVCFAVREAGYPFAAFGTFVPVFSLVLFSYVRCVLDF